MAKWAIEFGSGAEKDLVKLDRSIRRRVLDKLEWFSDNFDYTNPLPLGNEWRGFFKLRIGDRRIIYTIDYKRKVILIQYLNLRDKVYKVSGNKSK
ncbi:MAG: type II toxin-antitoxin system RelE/ParE family toxin [Patescibacteria group bacterium]